MMYSTRLRLQKQQQQLLYQQVNMEWRSVSRLYSPLQIRERRRVKPFLLLSSLFLLSHSSSNKEQIAVKTLYSTARCYGDSATSITSEQLRKAYATLGLHTSASDAEIKQAYQRYVKLYHPDLCHQHIPETHTPSSSLEKEEEEEEEALATSITESTNNKTKEINAKINVRLANSSNEFMNERIKQREEDIRDRMAAGNNAYQVLRSMTMSQREKLLHHKLTFNDLNRFTEYASSRADNTVINNNGSSFHCSPEAYERAQRAYYGEARAVRSKRAKIKSHKTPARDQHSSYEAHTTISTKEFNTFMSAPDNTSFSEVNSQKASNTPSRHRSHINSLSPKSLSNVITKCCENCNEAMQWAYCTFQHACQRIKTTYHTKIKKRFTQYCYHSNSNSNSSNNNNNNNYRYSNNAHAHESSVHEEIKDSNKSHQRSPYFSLHYMTINAHNLHRLHRMHATVQTANSSYTHEHSPSHEVGNDVLAKSRKNYKLLQEQEWEELEQQQEEEQEHIKQKSLERNAKYKVEPVKHDETRYSDNKSSEPLQSLRDGENILFNNTNNDNHDSSNIKNKTNSTQVPFNKTAPYRLRLVYVNNVPKVIQEEISVSTKGNNITHTTTFTTTTTTTIPPFIYLSRSCFTQLREFIETVLPAMITKFATNCYTLVKRNVLDKPVVFSSISYQLQYRHIVYYASTLAILCVMFILLDSFISLPNHN